MNADRIEFYSNQLRGVKISELGRKIRDVLRAAVDEESRSIRKTVDDNNAAIDADLDELAAELAAQAVRTEKIEKDAARYRYLQEHARFEWRNGPGLYWYLPRGGEGSPGDRLSASIDGSLAAIAAHRGQS